MDLSRSGMGVEMGGVESVCDEVLQGDVIVPWAPARIRGVVEIGGCLEVLEVEVGGCAEVLEGGVELAYFYFYRPL